MQKVLFLPVFVVLSILFFSGTLNGQCNDQVTHVSGTQQVGCTSVSVTSQGSAGNLTVCAKGPYLIGNIGPGSYTFTFSPAIVGVKIGVYALNNDALGFEEMAVTVNGAFFPITDPGVPDNCLQPAVISPTGTIQACSGCASSWDDIELTASITTLKVEDVYLSGSPSGIIFSLYICCPPCPTDAGTITASPLTICGNDPAAVPPATQSVLETDDILQYVLFANPADTLGSIIATGSSPTFSFDPNTMEYGETYFLAAIAGNNLNGNVDTADPCLDFSNAIEIVWNPLPTASFAGLPDACGGSCRTVSVNFTGAPPFSLTYKVTLGTSEQTFTESFQGSTGSFQVCPPAGFAGTVALEGLDLSDANCSCL